MTFSHLIEFRFDHIKQAIEVGIKQFYNLRLQFLTENFVDIWYQSVNSLLKLSFVIWICHEDSRLELLDCINAKL